MKKRLLVLAISLFLVLPSLLTACSTNDDPVDDSNTDNIIDENNEISTESAEVNTSEYNYPEIDLGGRDFRVLSVTSGWGFINEIDFDEETGNVLNDAIYSRNRLIEDKFNINIVPVYMDISQLTGQLSNSILADADDYDMSLFSPLDTPTGALVAQNLFYKIDSIPEINLDGFWWNQSAIENSRLGENNSVYFLQNEIHMKSLQGVWCVFFNERMMSDLGLTFPYQIAREGKWTLDKLAEYSKAGANLNGDDSFDWSQAGNAVYGLTTFNDGLSAMVTGFGEPYIRKGSNNMPYLSVENERFYSTVSKITDITAASGQYLDANASDGRHYEQIFRNGRALFMIGEFKAADTLRNTEEPFGILPMPKFDESQENYHHMLFRFAPVAVIPVTNSILRETAIILDAWQYLSNTTVTPTYHNVTLSFKELRNDDSIEMMHIINNSVSLDLGVTYGWTNNLDTDIKNALSAGSITPVSLIEARKGEIEAAINSTLAALTNMGD